jgi:hypothetical protein
MPVYRASLAGALAEAGYTEQAQAEVERLAAGDLAAVTRDFLERDPGHVGGCLSLPRRHHPRR